MTRDEPPTNVNGDPEREAACAVTREPDEPPVEPQPAKPIGMARVMLTVNDDSGRKLAVEIPIVRGLGLHAVAGIRLAGLYVIKVPTSHGPMQKMQPVPIDVDPHATLGEAVYEGFRNYDAHVEEAKRLAMEDLVEQNRPKIQPAGVMP